jgi:spore maturation protein SpmA
MSSDADQARQLADLFANMAQEIDAYREQHFNDLSVPQRTILEDAIQKLDDAHDTFTSIAIQDTLNALPDDISQIAAITTQAQKTLKHLNEVAKIVSIASSLAGLAMAITTADYGLIPTAIVSIANVLNQPDTPPAATA